MDARNLEVALDTEKDNWLQRVEQIRDNVRHTSEQHFHNVMDDDTTLCNAMQFSFLEMTCRLLEPLFELDDDRNGR